MSNPSRTLAALVAALSTISTFADPGPLELWSPTPAISWNQEAYPIGNGKLAAMIFGIVGTEQMQFNEETVWCGQPHDYSNPAATPAHLASIRSNTFARNDTAIWNEASQFLMSYPLRQAHYQPTATLNLNFSPHSGTSNYRRTLDLNTGTVTVRYDYGGVTYTREFFASNPTNRCLIVRLTASQAGKISFTTTFTTLQATYAFSTSGNDLIMNAKVTNKPDALYWTIPPGMTNAIEFQTRVRVLNEGGSQSSTSSSITVTNADAVTLLVSAASNYKNFEDLSNDETLICSNNIANAATNTYAQLRASQLADYQSLFNRVTLDLGLGNSSKTNFPTGYRIKNAFQGDDHQLSTIYFQMGRYMTIAGSRAGSHPLNLQGKWNDLVDPNWESKHTLNVNQMLNYSGTEMANLSECHEPMMDMIADLAITGGRVASNIYYSDGWVVHHNTDLWRGAAPINGRDGIWPAGQAWLAQNLWWHYQYTGDTNYLATKAYPLMKGALQFFEDFLIPHATNANWLVTCPSYSSEHNWKSGSIEVANVPGPTMDNELIRELCDYVVKSSEILGIDSAFRSNAIVLRAKLPPNKIGQFGQLQEWIEDVDTANDTHRHCSHLVGLYPGETISPFYTPTMAAAAKISTDARCSSPSTDIGWGHAWRLGLQARLGNSHFTHLYVTNLLQRHVSTNLMFTDGVNRQVDGIFGSLGSVCETMLQSQWGELHLLPAIPTRWTNGAVSGLRGRGGFEVGVSWTNRQLASATVKSLLGNTCRIRSRWPVDVLLGTNAVTAPMIFPGVYEFTTVAGSNYSVVPARIYEAEQSVATTSAGDSHTTQVNSAFSNVRGTLLSANAATDFVAYTLTNIPAGNWRIRVVADCGTNRARFQLTSGPGGSLTNVGTICDTYSATNVAGLYPSNGITGQIMWTNMLKEFDLGDWNAPTNGNYEFRFTAVDKNASSTGYWLSFDHVKLTAAPAAAAPANNAPTDIQLADANVTENRPIGTGAGTFTTTDPDAGNTFTYSLVAGAGSADNASFTISSNALLTAASFNYEAQASYSIRVRSTDQGSLSFEKAFTVTINNTNEAPTDISLVGSSVTENLPPGTSVGTLGTSDPDSPDSFTYTLVAGAGSSHNASFALTGNLLSTTTSFDHETQPSLSIRIRSTDAGGLFFEKALALTVANTNEAPATPANLTPANAALDIATAPTLSASAFADPDAGDAHAASQWLVRRTSDNALVFDSGTDALNLTAISLPVSALDFGTDYQWQSRQRDASGLWSAYSTLTSFSTLAPTLDVGLFSTQIVLSWPTNTPGFNLEAATNLTGAPWSGVLPPPVLFNSLNVVTNTADTEQKFYRLHKP